MESHRRQENQAVLALQGDGQGTRDNAMTYTDHTANFRRFQAAVICEQCHALYETCPHHRRGIRAALRALWQRWANTRDRQREKRDVARLRMQIAALNAQLTEAEGRLDEEIERRKAAEREAVQARLLAHHSLIAIDGRKGRA